MNKQDPPYLPVSCELHSQYELAIMQGLALKLVWQDGQQTHISTVTPLDLQTRQGQEFLIARDQQGQLLQIRLDYIQQHSRLD